MARSWVLLDWWGRVEPRRSAPCLVPISRMPVESCSDQDGPPVRFRHPRQVVQAGIGLVPEDRARHGLLLPQSVRVNTTLARLDEVTEPRGWIRADRERRTSERVCHGLDVQKESIEQPVAELSGGNQQKVLMARWLLRDL